MNDKSDEDIFDTKLIKSANAFPVVGIGASAGGLDAFKKFIRAIPSRSGMAYVLVQHLDPTHESILAELLQKSTEIPVFEITDDLRVKPDHIYIIPSNRMLIANDGVLLLRPRATTKAHHNMPIDLFFSSLAAVHQANAIGIILSGTASDGTIGLKAIKDLGGLTFAQDEASAAYNSMPQSAIDADVVDFVLPPGEMPQKLLEMVQFRESTEEASGGSEVSAAEEVTYHDILLLLRMRKGTDFSNYKQSTIRRRIQRRMMLHKNEAPSVYLEILKENSGEQDALYQDLLIPVTAFFRDQQVFTNLSESVIPAILNLKADNEPVRFWVASCSTGEEAYSLAICLLECIGKRKLFAQIFATDISEPALAKARRGIYNLKDLEGVSPERLQNFFIKKDGGYQLVKEVRDICVFSLHNFLKDPPFAQIDFLSCRNVLIYMETYLHKKALTTFHFALKSSGYLLLGKSETVSSVPDLFTSASRADKLYSRKNVLTRFQLATAYRGEKELYSGDKIQKGELLQTDPEKKADEILLAGYMPAGVVINHLMDVVQFRGATEDYLAQPSGKPVQNLFKLAKHGLAFELRTLLANTKKQQRPVSKKDIRFEINGMDSLVNIEVIPLPNIAEPHYLVLFIRPVTFDSSQVPQKKAGTRKGEKDRYILSLENELTQTRLDICNITQDQEATNEELQTSNEELLSGTEELQSLNEELETSKEELQTTNEELISLNDEVTIAKHYSELIVSTVREPLLILNKDLRVKTANESFYQTFHVDASDTEGMLIYDLGNKQWDLPALRHLLEEIIPYKTVIKDFEVSANFAGLGDRILLLNGRKMISEKSPEKLILLAIEDITIRREAERKLEESEAFNRSVLENSPDCIKILDLEGRLQYMNNNGICLMEIDDFEAMRNRYWPDLWDLENRPVIENALTQALKGKKTQFRASAITLKGTFKWWDVIVSPVMAPGSSFKVQTILSVSRDITMEVNTQHLETELLSRFHHIVLQVTVGIVILRGSDLIIEMANAAFLTMAGRTEADLVGKSLFMYNSTIRPVVEPVLLGILESGIPYVGTEVEFEFQRNGRLEKAYFNFVCQPLLEYNKTVSGIICVVNEVTELVIARKKMEAQALMVENLLMTAPGFISTLGGPDHVYQLVNEQYQLLFGSRPLQGLPILEALPELAGQGFDILLDHVYQTGIPYVGNEVPITLARDRDLLPELRYFNFSYQPMYDVEKAIYAILVFGYEVTEQVKAKNKNTDDHHLREKLLEEKVQLRTFELSKANEDLIKMNKELQAFSFVSSHDLQEPLRKIKTFVKLILEREVHNLSEQGKDYFRRILNSTTRMQTLIEDLLVYSQANVSERVFEDTSPEQILKEVQTELSEDILIKQAVIECHLPGELSVIRFQFRQLFTNLISNSLKFSLPDVPPRIVITGETGMGGDFNQQLALISTERLFPAINYYHLSFVDNGVGFETHFNKKIFEMFQRLHSKKEYPGTGIGLAIVKKIVENHQGLIFASGELGIGARFDIYIPVNRY